MCWLRHQVELFVKGGQALLQPGDVLPLVALGLFEVG